MTNQDLMFLPDPTNAQDVAMKNYVDTSLTHDIYTGSMESSSPLMTWQMVGLSAGCITSLSTNTIYLKPRLWRLSLFSKTASQEAKIELTVIVHETVSNLITGFIKNQFEFTRTLNLSHDTIIKVTVQNHNDAGNLNVTVTLLTEKL